MITKMFFKESRVFFDGLRILHSIQPGLILYSIVMAFIDALYPLLNIYMSAKIVNVIIEEKSAETLIFYAVITVFLNLIICISNHALNRARELNNSSFYFKNILNVSFKNYEIDFAAFETANSREDFQKVHDSFMYGGLSSLHKYLYDLLKNICSILISVCMFWDIFVIDKGNRYYGLLGFANSKFAVYLVFFLITISSVIVIYVNAKHDHKIFLNNQEKSKFNKFWHFYEKEYIEDINSGKDIRLYEQDKILVNEIAKIDNRIKKIDMIKKEEDTKCLVTLSILSNLMNCVVYIFVTLKTIIGIISPGDIIQYVGAISRFINSISGMVTSLVQIKENNRYLYALNEYMGYYSNNMYEKKCLEEFVNKEVTVEFHNVSYKYENSDTYALKDFSFRMSAGEKIAVVGVNGSGKTTMIKLLCGLYEPTDGYITLNGKKINEYDKKTYFKYFSIVFQDFSLLGFSIAHNIASQVNYDENSLMETIEEAGLTNFINKFEEGVHTKIGKDFYEQGIEVSGGEAQKIAIARSLYKDSPVVIMDEPTASLDPIAEAEIYEKLNTLVNNKTAIFISHRLSSCKFCDKIIVLDAGIMVEVGKHDSLLKKNGKYNELWNAQANYYRNSV